jgi:hypothetical protein
VSTSDGVALDSAPKKSSNTFQPDFVGSAAELAAEEIEEVIIVAVEVMASVFDSWVLEADQYGVRT